MQGQRVLRYNTFQSLRCPIFGVNIWMNSFVSRITGNVCCWVNERHTPKVSMLLLSITMSSANGLNGVSTFYNRILSFWLMIELVVAFFGIQLMRHNSDCEGGNTWDHFVRFIPSMFPRSLQQTQRAKPQNSVTCSLGTARYRMECTSCHRAIS